MARSIRESATCCSCVATRTFPSKTSSATAASTAGSDACAPSPVSSEAWYARSASPNSGASSNTGITQSHLEPFRLGPPARSISSSHLTNCGATSAMIGQFRRRPIQPGLAEGTPVPHPTPVTPKVMPDEVEHHAGTHRVADQGRGHSPGRGLVVQDSFGCALSRSRVGDTSYAGSAPATCGRRQPRTLLQVRPTSIGGLGGGVMLPRRLGGGRGANVRGAPGRARVGLGIARRGEPVRARRGGLAVVEPWSVSRGVLRCPVAEPGAPVPADAHDAASASWLFGGLRDVGGPGSGGVGLLPGPCRVW